MNLETFNFDNLAVEAAFQDKKAYEDTRFYKLTKDAEGKGAARIRFLPDAEGKTIERLYKINVNTMRDGEKRWFNDWSPQNINQPDPFHDEWARLWNSGQKEEARKFSRQTRYIANILVEKDPSNPENEGKVFLLDMSQSLADILKDAMMPSKEEMALGKKPLKLFNPLEGNSFKLISKTGSNGFLSYESSTPDIETTSAFASKEEAIEVIKTKCYPLSDFFKPENYKTLDELKEKLAYVKFEEKKEDKSLEVVDTSNSAQIAESVKPAQNADLESFLDSVM